jgi:riboflavin kinase/FMN adenylyltransferase
MKVNRGVTIGVFDGLHIAHQNIIKELIRYSKEYSLKPTVLTFNIHPQIILYKDSLKPLLPIEKKISILKELGVEEVNILKFNNKFYNITADYFVEKILINKFKTKLLVLGEDFRFGKNASGDINLLQKYNNFILKVKKIEKINGKKISSSNIRELLSQGKVEEAKELLGRFYSIEGKVVKSAGRGKALLGYPTVNLRIPQDLTVPLFGVYLVKFKIDTQTYWGMANLGKRPTFDDLAFLEVFIFSFDKKIYHKKIEVFFVKRLRDQRKFKDEFELKLQLKKDEKLAYSMIKDYYEK